jgi:hypothetical protein
MSECLCPEWMRPIRDGRHAAGCPLDSPVPTSAPSEKMPMACPASESKGAYVAKRAPLEERFWRYVTRGDPDACWPWTGTHIKQGYGQISAGQGKRMILAHRLSYEMHVGPVAAGLSVLHRCDNPPCVNPAHLFLGTKRDNTLDALAKGRHTSPRNLLHGKARP